MTKTFHFHHNDEHRQHHHHCECGNMNLILEKVFYFLAIINCNFRPIQLKIMKLKPYFNG